MRGNSFLPQPTMGTQQVDNVVEQNQEPNQLRMFQPGPPVHHKPPLKKRKFPPYTGMTQYEDPEYAPHHEEIPAQLDVGAKKAEEQSKYDPWSDPNISGDPHKTIIEARPNPTTSEEKLKGMLKSMENLRKGSILPDELLRLIFKYLPFALRCMCVCLDWRRVLLEKNWDVIDLRTIDNNSALIILDCLLSNSFDLKKITLDTIDPYICSLLYKSAHRIQQLICQDCRGVPPEHMRTLIKAMNSASKIELYKWELADMSMEKTTILSRVETWCENCEYYPLDSGLVNGVQIPKDDLTWQQIPIIAEEKLHQPFQDEYPVSLAITANPNHEFEAWRDDDEEQYLEEHH